MALIHFFEMTATLSGLLNNYLIVRENIWNWLFGILTVSIYAVIFFHVKLYADMGLQLIFFSLQFYGLYQWLYGSKQQTALAITEATKTIWLIASLSTFILFGNIAYLLQHYTDSTTIWIDALTTALSLVAQWMMSKKWIEHWWVWMIVNIVSINMYLNKHLYFTSILYAIYFFLCVLGYYTWKKRLFNLSFSKTPLLEACE